jgi:uncharacterized membrane protein YphA (DoxX/SURF4 family)
MLILNPFPTLLIFSFFAPTLLRIAAAAVFAYVAYAHYQKRRSLAQTRFPIMRGAWVVHLSIVAEVLVALALFAGYYTQIAAVVGLLIALKQLVWRNKYPNFFILPRTTSFLLLIICFTLLMSGAGALAFDLPL